MAITNMIPSIWSARLLMKLEKNLVYGQAGVINRNYEGEIREAGDRVFVHSFNDLTIGTYTKNSTTVTYEQLTDSRVQLLIDQSKFFAFKVDDIDRAQMKPDLVDAATDRAGYQLAQVADAHIASHYTAIPAGNQVAVSTPTAANIYQKFVQLARKMDDALIPEAGRFAVIPPFVKELLLQNDQFLAAQPSAVLNGQIGRIAGINLLVSPNVPVTGTPVDDYHIVAGISQAWSYAEQINNVEGIRLEGAFADGVRGLHLYGCDVLQPELLFDLVLSVA